MIIHRSFDFKAISQIINHPLVRAMMADDGTLDRVYVKEAFYLMDEDQKGVIRIDPINCVTCSAHIATLPEMWGHADTFTMSALRWGFNNTKYTKVVAMVPEYNKAARGLCARCGFEVEGRIKKSFLRNLTYYDMIIFGLTKTDFLGLS